jgi:hypothetical protein
MYHKQLAQLSHVPVTASCEALYMALGVQPLEWEAALRAVRFWNGLWALPPSDFWRHVALENWRYACEPQKLRRIDRGRLTRNFAYGMRAYLSDLGFDLPADSPRPVVDVAAVLQRLLDRRGARCASLHADPLLAPSQGVEFCAYVRYHHILPHEPVRPLYTLPLSLKASTTLLRFTLGRSSLPLHAGRHARPRVARSARHCPLCDMRVVGSEHHMFFVCPALADLRLASPALFAAFQRPAAHVVQLFMRHPLRYAVAGFILRSLARYRAAVSPP